MGFIRVKLVWQRVGTGLTQHIGADPMSWPMVQPTRKVAQRGQASDFFRVLMGFRGIFITQLIPQELQCHKGWIEFQRVIRELVCQKLHAVNGLVRVDFGLLVLTPQLKSLVGIFLGKVDPNEFIPTLDFDEFLCLGEFWLVFTFDDGLGHAIQLSGCLLSPRDEGTVQVRLAEQAQSQFDFPDFVRLRSGRDDFLKQGFGLLLFIRCRWLFLEKCQHLQALCGSCGLHRRDPTHENHTESRKCSRFFNFMSRVVSAQGRGQVRCAAIALPTSKVPCSEPARGTVSP